MYIQRKISSCTKIIFFAITFNVIASPLVALNKNTGPLENSLINNDTIELLLSVQELANLTKVAIPSDVELLLQYLENNKAPSDSIIIKGIAAGLEYLSGTKKMLKKISDVTDTTDKALHKGLMIGNELFDINEADAETVFRVFPQTASAGQQLINFDLYVNGSTTIRNQAQLYTLDCLYGSTMRQSLNVNGNVWDAGKLDVVGATQARSSLNVTGTAQLNGNVGIGGTLNVTGASTLSNLNVTGTTTTGWLDALGTAILHKDLTVRGSTTFVGTVNLGAETVASILDTGTLDVYGAAQAHNAFTVTGSTRLTGNVWDAGRLDVVGATQARSSLNVTGTSQLNGNVGIGGTLNVTGALTLSSLTVSGTTSVGWFDALGTSILHKDLTVRGSTTLEGDINVNNNALYMTAASGNFFTSGRLLIHGDLINTSTVNLKDVKVTATIGTTPSPILKLTFKNTAGTGSFLRQGAYVKIYALISGANGVTACESFAEEAFIITPGATAASTPNLITAANTVANVTGNVLTVAPSVGGAGTTAALRFALNTALTGQSTVIFYEIWSDNLVSVS